MRWKFGYTKHLPLSNFDTSSYDGDGGQTQNHLSDFYTFWNKDGPYNFNKIYGYQYIPKNKSDEICAGLAPEFKNDLMSLFKVFEFMSNELATKSWRKGHILDFKVYHGKAKIAEWTFFEK